MIAISCVHFGKSKHTIEPLARKCLLSGSTRRERIEPSRQDSSDILRHKKRPQGSTSEEAGMERKKATDFPQELLNLFDLYVHGRMSRRAFLEGAQRFAVAGASAAALFEMLRPNYAWAIQVQPDDKRIRTETVVMPSPKGNGSI
jgi:hypothetical protein